ncbi:MAG: UDP-3-O-(3-hydroxymyristoyl)glucosamine N-acyltransferase, partial [Cyanobacteriota bacterium]
PKGSLKVDAGAERALLERGIAGVALKNPRLGFAEALAALHPVTPKPPGIHPSAVVDSAATVSAEAHVGAHVVVGAGSIVPRGCALHPGVVLYEDVQLGEGCEIHANAVLHPGSRLGAGCVVQSNAVIGAEGFGFVPTASGWVKMPQTGQVVLEDGVEVGCGSTIDRPSVGETRIGAGTKIDNLVHVGHGVVTGRGCALAAQVGIAGGAVLGDGVILAGQVGVANKAVIGDRAIASSKSGIHGEVAAGEVVSGYPAIPNRLWLRCSAAFNKLPEMARTLRRLSSDGG